jgi:hypothetical protein
MGQPAVANCWNGTSYEMGDPNYEQRFFTTCLGDKCIEDEMIFECVNASWMGTAFVGGYEVSCDVQVEGESYNTTTTSGQCVYSLAGYEIDDTVLDLLSCTPHDPSDLGCSWFPND